MHLSQAIYPTVIIALVSLDSVIVDMPRTRSPSGTLSSGVVQTHLSFAANPSTTKSGTGTAVTQGSAMVHQIDVAHTLNTSSLHLDSSSRRSEPQIADDPEKQ
jgi:hypothetical protein